MRSTVRLCARLVVLSLVGSAVACSDSSAPQNAAPHHPAPALLLAEGGAAGTNVTTFVYSPANPQVFNLGKGHKIFFDANAVCDPAVSTYGPTEWDQPCEPLATPIAITAVVSENAHGRPRVDFSPALRFVPGSYVVLYLKDWSAAADSAAIIQWCPDEGECVSEEDHTVVVTKRDGKSGFVYRLIKHFSGFNISV